MVDAMRSGAWLRSGEGIGWLAAGTIFETISIYQVPFFYLFLAACNVLCVCSYLFVVFFYFHALVGALYYTTVDVPLRSFPVQQTAYRIGNHVVYYRVWLRPDRLM